MSAQLFHHPAELAFLQRQLVGSFKAIVVPLLPRDYGLPVRPLRKLLSSNLDQFSFLIKFGLRRCFFRELAPKNGKRGHEE